MMIKDIGKEDIAECARVVRSSFQTVAEELGLTAENAPGFTAFAATEERLTYQLENENRLMRALYDGGNQMIGYYSLLLLENGACELNNLCVLPKHRHRRFGRALLDDACGMARRLGRSKIKIGIVEENAVLRRWYEENGFVHTGTKKFDFFPFTCGYMEKDV